MSDNSFSIQDRQRMAMAISLAKKGWNTTRSNPRVGCVLFQGEQLIGQGWHQKAGLAHAEVNAIIDAKAKGFSIEGATAYVSLEPCAHQGKTPACAQALIEVGVAKVICAMQDPNPLVAGQGLAMLEKAGIETLSGLLEREALQLNKGFVKRMKQGLPRIVVKLAMSLDGRTAMENGESQWITGPQARADVQRLRAQSGAIITGSGTVITDDPSMTVRQASFINDPYFEQPLRVVIDSQAQVSVQANIFKQQGACWWVTCGPEVETDLINLEQKKIVAEYDKVNLLELLQELSNNGINDVLLEAGSGLAGAFIQQGLVDEIVIYMAAKLMGHKAQPLADLAFDSMSQTLDLQLEDCRMVGSDIRLIYQIKQ